MFSCGQLLRRALRSLNAGRANLEIVRTRILIAVSAWLLGAVTATGGSLLAVSQLGQGLVDSTNQQLTTGAVNSALAREQAGQAATSPARPPHTARPAHRTRAVHAVHPAARMHQPSPAATPPPAEPPGTLLASAGGTVLATCQPAGAYLLSWSPQQGYEALGVVRGPAAVVSVRFAAPSRSLTMRVTCNQGLPTALQSSGGGGGDDNGRDRKSVV